MIFGINHVQISIPKGAEEQARLFYCELLGLTELEKPEVLKRNGGLWLKVGSTQLHLGIEDLENRHKSKAHVAFEIEDEQSMRELLQCNNVEVMENTQIKGYKRFDIRDPFGNRLEFMEKI
ncbi:VOC family protein [Celerinatantimonas diazotrophica]|uniref:Catechol 2,3-dioxygenase-like lactoylglutathione lyase family enzyme n=1 Tax=Celerinatantimonas diazotrophica TaxID=412034 RepID=A0A4R1J9R5_9GAMM|nr:VOC family protein [Celerinatantimonas diazotrophica]TCK47174.1 catechol 2,3-dioxygenase-like lactoylglutathione lyase family enzyme [Celerinatantimonas diazotrophica]CAG9295947.1 hypothetical protein CEDIAZO_01081 [Celerinatantimonas diazotrophica]